MITLYGVSLALIGAAIVIWGLFLVRNCLNEIAFLHSEVAALRIMNKIANKSVEERNIVIGCLRSALDESQAEVKQLRQSTPVHIAAITARENNWRFN